jgi:peptide/nickel transport system ATP-binding protein
MSAATTPAAATSPDAPVLEVRGLTKRFRQGGMFRSLQVSALTDVSFTVNAGEVVALVGESGSGKSTTARLISRLVEPTAGEILLHGRNVLQEERRGATRSYRRAIQMIFQDPYASLNPIMTVGAHIERPLRIHRPDVADRRAAVLSLLAAVGLNPPDSYAEKHPYELSGGQRQRVAIARALAADPEIILADEPISMLDVSIRMGVLNILEKLKTERKIGFLYITHDLASARYIGDRTMVMFRGHVVESAESTELMAAPAHPYTKMLLEAVPHPERRMPAREAGKAPAISKVAPLEGCPFAYRCPQVMDACRTVLPPLAPIAPGHDVRCHLYPPSSSGA